MRIVLLLRSRRRFLRCKKFEIDMYGEVLIGDMEGSSSVGVGEGVLLAGACFRVDGTEGNYKGRHK